MIKTVGAALDGFGNLPYEDRKLLFETFRVWQDNDASGRGALWYLFTTPNTVYERLASNRETHRPIPLAVEGCRRTVSGLRSVLM